CSSVAGRTSSSATSALANDRTSRARQPLSRQLHKRSRATGLSRKANAQNTTRDQHRYHLNGIDVRDHGDREWWRCANPHCPLTTPHYSAVVGSITVPTSRIVVTGKPPHSACSRTASASSAT